MLRITVNPLPGGAEIVVEGRLTGPWVEELDCCWRDLLAKQDPRSIRVDLDAATFIDEGGKALLRAIHHSGATLTAKSVLPRAIIDEIVSPTEPSH